MQIKKKEIEFQKQKQITIFRGDKNGDYKKHEAGAGSKSNEHAVQFAVSGRYKKCVQIDCECNWDSNEDDDQGDQTRVPEHFVALFFCSLNKFQWNRSKLKVHLFRNCVHLFSPRIRELNNEQEVDDYIQATAVILINIQTWKI